MFIFILQVLNMMGQCVIHADSSPYLVYVGSVLNVPTLTCVPCVTMLTNIIYDIASTGLQLLELKGEN